MNFCSKCGNKLQPGQAFCTNCGNKIGVNNQVVNNTPSNNQQTISPEDDKMANLLATLALILFFSPGIPTILNSVKVFYQLSKALETITSMGLLASIVLIIIARVKYPKNKFSKIVMWIMIGMTALGLVLIMIIMLACVTMCASF
jgi:uncharacterized membrane protein YvbJ